jgi:anti-sigma regulatory factor (Ser/Thr protein kinase)
MHQIELPGAWTSLPALSAFVDEVERALPLSDAQRYVLRLVVEEIVTNIIKYGYDDARRDVIRVACSYDDRTLTLCIADRGRPYDPRAHPAPPLPDGAAEREPGGLGIFFVREYADQLSYRHDPLSGWNELVVTRGP